MVATAVLVVLALVAGAACDGDGDISSACDLLSDSEAEEILGVATRPGVEDDERLDPGSSCAWVSEDSSEEPHARVYGVVISESSGSEARADFAETRDADSRIYVVEPVEGLGDEAYHVVYTEPNNLSQEPSLPNLHVQVGDRILRLGTYDSEERPVEMDEAMSIERAAADVAVAGLTE